MMIRLVHLPYFIPGHIETSWRLEPEHYTHCQSHARVLYSISDLLVACVPGLDVDTPLSTDEEA